ncbi:hypothetical protein HPG69_009026 [Diceros bicornis minor]|uniref:Synaptosomal-associated protein n=1 Tax=Diceros bicornis minor TaxID=77932 RepID=A0A7J7EB85_DICBM|nr:hypothetical protein HPG69_009026 [Diceros bicornis minor]
MKTFKDLKASRKGNNFRSYENHVNRKETTDFGIASTQHLPLTPKPPSNFLIRISIVLSISTKEALNYTDINTDFMQNTVTHCEKEQTKKIQKTSSRAKELGKKEGGEEREKEEETPEKESLVTKNFESSKAYKATWGDGGDNYPSNVLSKQPGHVTNGQPQQATIGAASSGYIKRITNDAREEEMEENLTQAGSILGHLKNMALDMGNEIEAQNQQTEHITKKADTNKDRIDNANARAKKLTDS